MRRYVSIFWLVQNHERTTLVTNRIEKLEEVLRADELKA